MRWVVPIAMAFFCACGGGVWSDPTLDPAPARNGAPDADRQDGPSEHRSDGVVVEPEPESGPDASVLEAGDGLGERISTEDAPETGAVVSSDANDARGLTDISHDATDDGPDVSTDGTVVVPDVSLDASSGEDALDESSERDALDASSDAPDAGDDRAVGDESISEAPDSGDDARIADVSMGDAAPDSGTPFSFDPGTTRPSCAGLTRPCGELAPSSCCSTLPVPGGSFSMGGTIYPLVTTTVSSYYLDEYEVTTGRFRAFLANFDAWRAAGNPMDGAGAHPLIADSGWQSHWNVYLSAQEAGLWNDSSLCPMRNWDFADDNEPVNCVTWYEAFAFCLWDQARLPTGAEWENAAIGGNLSRTYPWGSAPMDPQVNCNFECMGDGLGDCTTADLLPVGSRPSGAGLWGHQDLLGSMAEWVLDLAGWYSSPCVDCANVTVNVTTSTFRTMRGGGWTDTGAYVSSIRRDYLSEPDAGETTAVRWNSLGARCARSLPGAGAGEP